MISILDLDEKRIYVENEKWSCYFGFGSPVRLGLVLEAVDLAAESDRCNEDLDWENPIFESHWDEDSNQRYSIVIDAYIIPQPEYLDEEIVDQARDEGASSRIDLISYVYENHGGVPVNIDAVQPAKSSCGFSSFVAETNISSVENPSGDEIEMRHFQDRSEAMKFAKDFYAVYAGQLFNFIDLLLDNPLLAGGTGWDKIRDLTKPGSTHSKK